MSNHTTAEFFPTIPDDLPLRDPDEVMQAERLGVAWLSRLSFVRTMIKRITQHRWQIKIIQFDVDAEGCGEIIYHIQTHERPLHFIIFSNKL
ncbi:MAG: hypothetical protein AAF485_28355, partial [Chloroflexota bacterium]